MRSVEEEGFYGAQKPIVVFDENIGKAVLFDGEVDLMGGGFWVANNGVWENVSYGSGGGGVSYIIPKDAVVYDGWLYLFASTDQGVIVYRVYSDTGNLSLLGQWAVGGAGAGLVTARTGAAVWYEVGGGPTAMEARLSYVVKATQHTWNTSLCALGVDGMGDWVDEFDIPLGGEYKISVQLVTSANRHAVLYTRWAEGSGSFKEKFTLSQTTSCSSQYEWNDHPSEMSSYPNPNRDYENLALFWLGPGNGERLAYEDFSAGGERELFNWAYGYQTPSLFRIRMQGRLKGVNDWETWMVLAREEDDMVLYGSYGGSLQAFQTADDQGDPISIAQGELFDFIELEEGRLQVVSVAGSWILLDEFSPLTPTPISTLTPTPASFPGGGRGQLTVEPGANTYEDVVLF